MPIPPVDENFIRYFAKFYKVTLLENINDNPILFPKYLDYCWLLSFMTILEVNIK